MRCDKKNVDISHGTPYIPFHYYEEYRLWYSLRFSHKAMLSSLLPFVFKMFFFGFCFPSWLPHLNSRRRDYSMLKHSWYFCSISCYFNICVLGFLSYTIFPIGFLKQFWRCGMFVEHWLIKENCQIYVWARAYLSLT
jgi:hypothetical protein